MKSKRPRRTYDYRLVQLVQESGDFSIATRLGVPRSTAAGWIRRERGPVTSAQGIEVSPKSMRARIARLERRSRLLAAALRVALVVLRMLEPGFSSIRVSDGDKRRFLRAIDRSRGVLGLRRILRIVGLSPSP